MLTIIYAFKVKEGKQMQFEAAWTALTTYILKNCKSLGSRLHRESSLQYIAYAQWPSQIIFEQAQKHSSAEMKTLKLKLQNTCIEVQKLHSLNTITDLTITTQ